MNLLNRTRPRLIAGVNYLTRIYGRFSDHLAELRDRQVPPVAPYRRIVKREPSHDQPWCEIVTLDCKHQYRLIHPHRDTMPCEHCARGDK